MKTLAKNQKCRVEGCDRLVGEHGSHGMCTKHARLEWGKRTKYSPPVVTKECNVEGCYKKAISNSSSYCASHFYQQKKYGKIIDAVVSTPAGRIKRREYWIWVAMRQRCNNPHDKAYKNYGGRGIKVCDRWDTKGGFDRFFEDMGPCNGLTLDRIDPNGDYSPKNCRWATRHQQNINKRTNRPHPCIFRNSKGFGVKVRVQGKTIRKTGFSSIKDAQKALALIRQENDLWK